MKGRINMKKLISILLIGMLLFSSISALAEDFTLHSGVTFGMTMDEVKSLEQNAGFAIETDDHKYDSSKVASALEVTGKIAGFENSDIHYLFDNSGKLYAATYWLRTNDALESDYATIQNALEGKYGNPNDAWLLVANRIGFEPNDYLSLAGLARNNKNVLPYYNSWLVELEDGNYVVIAHYKDSATVFGMTLNMHIVGYQWYSAEEMANELNDISNEADENQSQRDNDL